MNEHLLAYLLARIHRLERLVCSMHQRKDSWELFRDVDERLCKDGSRDWTPANESWLFVAKEILATIELETGERRPLENKP
jgi:hypothetical protein